METVTLEVATLKDIKRRARDAFKGRKQGARISFATPELLFQLMTAKRWELIRMMTGAGTAHDQRGCTTRRSRR
jgi:predicted transcriptional regulator